MRVGRGHIWAFGLEHWGQTIKKLQENKMVKTDQPNNRWTDGQSGHATKNWTGNIWYVQQNWPMISSMQNLVLVPWLLDSYSVIHKKNPMVSWLEICFNLHVFVSILICINWNISHKEISCNNICISLCYWFSVFHRLWLRGQLFKIDFNRSGC